MDLYEIIGNKMIENKNWKIKKFNSPFKHWIIEGFLSESECSHIIKHIIAQKFNRKDCDLFQFYQGEDLKKTKSTILKDFHKYFSSKDFINEISEITGKEGILKTIDMSPFIYDSTDYLLPHDDRLEGRRIAYILYLNTLEDSEKGNSGGTLDFFENKKIVKRIKPKAGNLVLFEVSDKSLHQVSEVISGRRITLAGWFHA